MNVLQIMITFIKTWSIQKPNLKVKIYTFGHSYIIVLKIYTVVPIVAKNLNVK